MRRRRGKDLTRKGTTQEEFEFSSRWVYVDPAKSFSCGEDHVAAAAAINVDLLNKTKFINSKSERSYISLSFFILFLKTISL